jgi:hypothetical protein
MAKQTFQEGANLERKAWMAKARRLRRDLPEAPSVETIINMLDGLISWGAKREKRTRAKRGGL